MESAAQNPSRVDNEPAPAPYRGGAIIALRAFAWLDLAGGFLSAVIVWLTAGTREVVLFGDITRTEANPLGIGLGFVLLFQGVFLCALFLVIAGAAEDLAAIRSARPIHETGIR